MNKCNSCKKKLSLSEQAMTCKCGHNYCFNHRQAEIHSCVFDFHKSDKNELEKRLTSGKTIADKLEKI